MKFISTRNLAVASFFLILAPHFMFAQSLTIENGATVTVDGDGNGGTVLDVDGDVDIQGELDLNVDALLRLSGDFIKNGTPSTFNIDNSTVEMYGFGNNEISGGTIPNNTSYSFYNLTINKSSGGSVTINTSNLTNSGITIRNVLNPVDGDFNTSDAIRLRAISYFNYARVEHGNGDIKGNVKVEKELTNTDAGWRQLSLPVNSSWENANWDGIITFNFSNFLPAGKINAFRWIASGSGGIADGWMPAPGTTSYTSPLTVYLEGGSADFDVSQTFSCTGELVDNVASFAFPLSFTRDPEDLSGANTAAVGWNHIPNPWAALVDVNELLTSTSFKAFEPQYKAVHVYNSVLGQYQAILLNNTVSKQDWNTDGTSIDDAEANIPPFQSFWVKADAANQTVTLYADEMQTPDFKNSLNERFMKQTPEILRLNVFDQDSMWDQLVTYFDESKTRNFDNVGDAYYLRSQIETAPIFYGLEGEIQSSIIGRQPNTTDSVEVVFGSTKNQSKFYIHADLDELGTGWYVYLKDRLNNKTYLLEDGQSLPFSHFNGTKTDRFVVYYSKNERAFSHMVDKTNANVVVYTAGENMILQTNGLSGRADVSVFDAVGRLHQKLTLDLTTGEEYELDINPANQIMIVETNINGQAFRNKIYH